MSGICRRCKGMTTNTRAASKLGLCFSCEFGLERSSTGNNTSRLPSDILMEALSDVEGAAQVIIIVEKENSLMIRTNCQIKDAKWLLDQASHSIMNDLFPS